MGHPPSALFTPGSALAASPVGRFWQRRGRRVGPGTGFTVGGLGAAGAVGAAVLDNVPGLFVSLHRRRRNRNLLAGPIRR
ncbi:MAG TPA: hypothetical protein VIU11_23265, partial [Nakamurella sp.]